MKGDRSPLRVFLTGFRGTGKSTVAKYLAAELRTRAVDLDQEIQKAAGKSIAEIFAEGGESAFRAAETDQLARVCEAEPAVVALGGGAILAAGNRELIKKSGKCVWLTASAETIAARMASDAATAAQRPALTKLSQLDEIRQLLEIREPLYREVADIVIDTESAKPEELASQLSRHFSHTLQ